MSTVRDIIEESNTLFQQLSNVGNDQSHEIKLEQLLADLDILLHDIEALENRAKVEGNYSGADAFAWCGKYLKKIRDNAKK